MEGGATLTPTAGSTGTAAAGELRRIVGPQHVLVDPDVTASYAVDWTRRWQGRTPVVVRPGT
ncbi:MAG: hypothetical protein M3527_03845, partial [Actinomycetota bacterium]|nr:hypothetical protein [Actinomycetota bacterium]